VPTQKIPRNLRPFIDILLRGTCTGVTEATSRADRLEEHVPPFGSIHAAETDQAAIVKEEKVWLVQ
jgi:hypothetical protein